MLMTTIKHFSLRVNDLIKDGNKINMTSPNIFTKQTYLLNMFGIYV